MHIPLNLKCVNDNTERCILVSLSSDLCAIQCISATYRSHKTQRTGSRRVCVDNVIATCHWSHYDVRNSHTTRFTHGRVGLHLNHDALTFM